MIKTIEINRKMGNINAIQLLENFGFKHQGVIDCNWNKEGYDFKVTKDMNDKHYFFKDNQFYMFIDWTHFNGFVEDVRVKKLK